jgi:hypothetical protein
MSKIGKQRLPTLQKWYPEDIQKPDDWVHKNCLAHLGLHPFPRGRIHFEHVIGTKVLKRIQDIITQHGNMRGARRLIDVVYKRLLDEYRVPTEEGRKQMRYMVSQWITTHMGEQRGGVTVADDTQGIGTITNGDMIDNIDGSFTMVSSTSTPIVDDPSTSLCALQWAESFIQLPADGVQRMIEYTRCMTELQRQIAQKESNRSEAEKSRALAEEKVVETEKQRGENERLRAAAEKAHEARLDKEILLIREKRAIDKLPQSECKKKRTDVTVTEDGPFQHGRLYSISHTALHWLYESHESETVPPLQRVFKVVHDWMVTKQLTYSLQFTTVDIGGIIIVYGNHKGPNRFRGTRYEDNLHKHLLTVLFHVSVDEDGPNPFVVSGTTAPSCVPVAPIFQPKKKTCPADWMGPSLEQQVADTQRLCQLLDMSPTEWPNAETEVDPDADFHFNGPFMCTTLNKSLPRRDYENATVVEASGVQRHVTSHWRVDPKGGARRASTHPRMVVHFRRAIEPFAWMEK